MGNASVQREFRIDFSGAAPVTSARSDGALVVPARLARTGMQRYEYASGKVVNEQRDAAEVFAPESLASFRGVTLTAHAHPINGVNPEVWRLVAVGHVGDDVRRDGKFMAATVYICDSGAIASVQRGELVELSCGYHCTMVEGAGVNDEGERYTTRQTSIRANHLSMGGPGFARGGPELRLAVPVVVDSTQASVDRIRATLQNVRGRIASGLLGAREVDDLRDYEDILLSELRNL